MLLWQPATVFCVVYYYLFHCLTWQINSLSLSPSLSLSLSLNVPKTATKSTENRRFLSFDVLFPENPTNMRVILILRETRSMDDSFVADSMGLSSF